MDLTIEQIKQLAKTSPAAEAMLKEIAPRDDSLEIRKMTLRDEKPDVLETDGGWVIPLIER